MLHCLRCSLRDSLMASHGGVVCIALHCTEHRVKDCEEEAGEGAEAGEDSSGLESGAGAAVEAAGVRKGDQACCGCTAAPHYTRLTNRDCCDRGWQKTSTQTNGELLDLWGSEATTVVKKKLAKPVAGAKKEAEKPKTKASSGAFWQAVENWPIR